MIVLENNKAFEVIPESKIEITKENLELKHESLLMNKRKLEDEFVSITEKLGLINKEINICKSICEKL